LDCPTFIYFYTFVGDVLTFLDAHCETTIGWLEPLLYRIKTNPKTAVSPIIDIISDDSFALLRSFELHHGGISWNLHFRWFGASETLMKVCYSLNGALNNNIYVY